MAKAPAVTDFTLRSFYDELFAPTFLVAARPKTYSAYNEALKHWATICGNTPLKAINGRDLAVFKQRLLDGTRPTPATKQLTFWKDAEAAKDGLARTTVNKHLRAIGALLSKAGPPGPRNRDAMAIIQNVPWTRPLKVQQKLPRAVRAEHVLAAYEACETARYPKLDGVRPGNWWKALYAVAYTAAFRRAALMAMEWDQVDVVAETISVAAEDDKCWTERIKPLNHVVLLHLVRIRTKAKRVFPWPHSERTWYTQWHRIQEAAEIPEEKRFGIHDLKRTAGTVYAAGGSPWIVQRMLDHSSINTSASYVNPVDQLRGAVDEFPLPLQICRDVGEDGPPKRRAK